MPDLTGSVRRDGTDLSNWQRHPHSVWGFQHTRELVPTASIGGSANPWILSRAAAEPTWGSRVLGASGQTLDDWIERTYTNGLLVCIDGVIFYERYLNGLTAERPHLAFSISKSIITTVAGTLAERGDLDLDRTVGSHYPRYQATAWEHVRLRDLGDMRAGVKFVEDPDAADSDAVDCEIAFGWTPRPPGSTVAADAATYFAGLPRTGPDGTFDYRSANTDVLGLVIEAATRQPLAEVIRDVLWSPMGAEHDADITLDSAGTALADGGICATLRDLARLGLLWAARGRRDTAQVVPESWIAETLTPTEKYLGDFPPERATSPASYYRNGWWIKDASSHAFAANGMLGQKISISEGGRVVIAKVSSWPDHTVELERETELGLDAIIALATEELS